VNKIKAHYEIVIPDEAQMQQLTSAEARNVFYNLLASEERTTPQAHIEDAPMDKAPNIVQTDEEPLEQKKSARPVADTPEQAVQPASPPDEKPVEPVEPVPQEDLAARGKEVEMELAKPESDYELRLTDDDAGVSTRTIKENEGTVVFEGKETAVSMAASPSPEVKQAMRSAVSEMEEQLVTLREEVKNLRQSLQGKENLLALKTETRLSSPPVEQPPAKPEPAPIEPLVSDEPQGPIELDVSQAAGSDDDFDYLRLILELVTLAAAVGIIGYLIILKRKDKSDEDELSTSSKYFRPTFTSGRSKPLPATPGAIQAASDVMPATTTGEEPKPHRHRSTDEYIASSPRFTLDKKDSIEVTEEAYDDSIDFSHSAEELDDEQGDVAEKATTQPPQERAEDFNAEYVLQEANLSIAFKDLENAHYQLTKLTNNVPRNPNYRLLMLGVLKDMNREDEFIYHANHLANITNKTLNSPWQKAYEIGRKLLPNHPLFSSPPEPAEQQPQIRSLLDDEPELKTVTPMDNPDTIVLDTRRALAEYERKMLAKEALENSSEKHKTVSGEEPVLDLNELPSSDEGEPDQAFRLDLAGRSSEQDTTADIAAEPEDLSDESESLPSQTDKPYEESVPSPKESDEVERVLEYDTTPTPATQLVKPESPSIDNLMGFDPATDEPRIQGTAEEIDAEHLDELTSETLASMAEFSAIEGIPLDEKILKQLSNAKDEDDNEDDDNTDKTVLTKPE